jgi:tetratricopeptide (TPR) repeat protein
VNKKAGRIAVPPRTGKGSGKASGKAPLSADTMNRMVALYSAGQWQQLEIAARDAVRQHPEHVFGWKALGKCLLQLGRPQDAIPAFEHAARIAPADADTYNDLAITFTNLGRREDAIASYRKLLKLAPGAAATHDTLGALLSDLGRFEEAEQEFHRALDLDPGYFQSRINLGFVYGHLLRWSEAEACYRLALEIQPEFSEIHRRLGDLLSKSPNRSADAIVHLQRAIELNPADAGSVITLGNVLMAEGRHDEARPLFLRARQIQPLITWPTKLGAPSFSLLLLDSPGAGSTPLNYLAGNAAYDCHFIGIMPGLEHDIAMLNGKCNLAFNMIADADNGKDILPLALELADKLTHTVANHPRKIMGTDRASIARKLTGIPLLRVPRTVRFAADAQHTITDAIKDLAFPLLIRCGGKHGGDDFEKAEDMQAIAAFIAQHPGATTYVTEFVDYRSADGYYRKYRLIFVNDEVLPYHLAIHNDWMVHHFRTDMGNHEWMRLEEEAFLRKPQGVFSAAHFAAFAQAAKAIGLDYCGMDCSLDREGNILVFEANATMLVHEEVNNAFVYKNPYIARIKVAFDAMLTRLAEASTVRQDHAPESLPGRDGSLPA